MQDNGISTRERKHLKDLFIWSQALTNALTGVVKCPSIMILANNAYVCYEQREIYQCLPIHEICNICQLFFIGHEN